MQLIVVRAGNIRLVMKQAFIDGRYSLYQLLGSGGMAQVYLTHDEVLDRHVALKILRDQYAEDEEFVERFRREARSAASLSHPNIVSIYDQGRSEDGTYYIAMEYVPGGTLKERIRQEGALAPEAALGVASQITDALSEAHKKGVIHRDIKPQNVLVTEKGDIKVVDFGIAKAAASSATTTTGVVFGTVEYMSPEQARGESIGPQSDLYSLGVLLYEMLTGALPYEADTPIGTAIKHVTAPVRSPSEVNPNVPEALSALTMKLLAKDPQGRYPSAAALSEDLERVRSGLPPVTVDAKKTEKMTVPLPPLARGGDERTTKTAVQSPTEAPSEADEGARRRRRSRPLYVLGALVLLSVVLLGGLAWALTRNTDSQSGVQDTQARSVRVPGLVYASTAQSDLAAAGLKLGRQDQALSNTVPAGLVTEQNPVEGTQVEEGTAVDIVVSQGPQQAPIGNGQQAEKQRERQQQEAEKQSEKQQQEAEKQREKQQQEAEKQKDKEK